MTFAINGVSRSLLAQLTRHRMSSFTSASQHYADYSDMPMVVGEQLADNSEAESCLNWALRGYSRLAYDGVPIEEARQVLPNACAVNILWTVNARSLLNFFTQRLCKRNVEEMLTFASKVFDEVDNYWPEYAALCGPFCYMNGGDCNQGKMSCNEPFIGE